ncbi:MAG: diaminopimelate epimerase [Candidatus Methanospirareceae archaeon]
MQGTGNDFIIIDNREEEIEEEEMASISRLLCRRRFSIGADGVLFVCKPTRDDYDIRMRIFNADGTEAEMSGNGMRCFAKYVYERGIVKKKKMRVETLGGLIIPEIIEKKQNGERYVRVFMGKPVFHFVNEDFYVDKNIGVIKLTYLSLGNPHAVIIVDKTTEDFKNMDIRPMGRSIETHKAFPNRTNVDFVKLIGEDEVMVRTYERGVGETLSCGTGSTASVTTLKKLGYVGDKVTVHTLGGDLVVEICEEGAYLSGPAEVVFEGEVTLSSKSLYKKFRDTELSLSVWPATNGKLNRA